MGKHRRSERTATDIAVTDEQERAWIRVSKPALRRTSASGVEKRIDDIASSRNHSSPAIRRDYQPSLPDTMMGTVRAMIEISRVTLRVRRYSRSNSILRRTSSTQVS